MTNLRQKLIQQNRFLLTLSTCLFVVFSLFNYRFNVVGDLSYNNRNSLHPDTQKILHLLKDDLAILAFVEKDIDKNNVKKSFKPLLNYKKNIHFTFINPLENPKTARELNYNPQTPVRISYQEKAVNINKVSKKDLHQALQKLINRENIQIAFSTGFGERQAYNDANFNYSQISRYLDESNLKIIEFDLRESSNVPENAALLVIAAPTEPLDKQSIEKITRFIERGGNMLWLADTDSRALPETIQTLLDIRLLDGIVVDAHSQKYIQNKPDFIPVESYIPNSILANMKTVTLFPQARGLQFTGSDKSATFTQQAILQSSINSWTETGAIRGNIAYDENTSETVGPVMIGATLSRSQPQRQDQRIVFLGDADFIANAYINNADNINLALRLFRWLTYQQELLSINAILAPDKELAMSNNTFFAISLFYIIILPGTFFATGIWLWHNRKHS